MGSDPDQHPSRATLAGETGRPAVRGEMVAPHRGRRCARIARRDDREYRAIFEGGATMRGAMQRRPNAGTISPRAARGAGSRRSLTVMPHRIPSRLLALPMVLVLAVPALAQTGLVKGKVVDAENKPVAD